MFLEGEDQLFFAHAMPAGDTVLAGQVRQGLLGAGLQLIASHAKLLRRPPDMSRQKVLTGAVPGSSQTPGVPFLGELRLTSMPFDRRHGPSPGAFARRAQSIRGQGKKKVGEPSLRPDHPSGEQARLVGRRKKANLLQEDCLRYASDFQRGTRWRSLVVVAEAGADGRHEQQKNATGRSENDDQPAGFRLAGHAAVVNHKFLSAARKAPFAGKPREARKPPPTRATL
jgi:hypothetical protein